MTTKMELPGHVYQSGGSMDVEKFKHISIDKHLTAA
jgi:hypothetical protein